MTTRRKQVVFKSPRLKRRYTDLDGDYLVKLHSGECVLCIGLLETFVDVPNAQSYWIEISAMQWADGSGSEIWLRCMAHDHKWWRAHRTIDSEFIHLECAVDEFINRKLKPNPDRLTRYFFRLVYEE